MSDDDRSLRDKAQRVASVLREAGHIAYFAGGCVRDQVRGVAPKDYDIATDARPDRVRALFPKTVPVGEAFGVILVVSEGSSFEVATFRKDADYTDGRHPTSVRFCDAREDALRRDFTMNGLFQDPFTGGIVDYVGGQADIRDRVIRTIGDAEARFLEDRLRMLRAIRFHSTLDFEIEPGTRQAIRELAPEIRAVSAERIRDEILRILTGPGPGRGFEALAETGLLREILPEVDRMRGTPQPPEFHPEGDVWTHTLMMLEALEDPSPELALGVLLHDVGKPLTLTREPDDRIRFHGHDDVGAEVASAICHRLRLSNEQVRRVEGLVRDHMKFISFPRMREAKQRRFLARDHIEDHLELHRVDCLSSHGRLETYDSCRKKLEELRDEPILPPPLINGDDLIELGLEPGPVFSEILREVQDAQLEGRLVTREEALEMVRRREEARESGG